MPLYEVFDQATHPTCDGNEHECCHALFAYRVGCTDQPWVAAHIFEQRGPVPRFDFYHHVRQELVYGETPSHALYRFCQWLNNGKDKSWLSDINLPKD